MWNSCDLSHVHRWIRFPFVCFCHFFLFCIMFTPFSHSRWIEHWRDPDTNEEIIPETYLTLVSSCKLCRWNDTMLKNMDTDYYLLLANTTTLQWTHSTFVTRINVRQEHISKNTSLMQFNLVFEICTISSGILCPFRNSLPSVSFPPFCHLKHFLHKNKLQKGLFSFLSDESNVQNIQYEAALYKTF